MTQATQARPSKLPRPNEACWCGSGSKYKKCHREDDELSGRPSPAGKRVLPGRVSPRREVPKHIARPDYVLDRQGRPGPGVLGDPSTRLARMRKACKAAAEVLGLAGKAVRPGITTDEIDALVHQAYIDRGGYPSTLGYHHFPKSMCTSVNEVILHGIPDSRALEDGDIVNLDVTIYLDGMHGDCSATFGVGKVDEESERLMRVTRECLMLGIEAVKPGRQIRAIGQAIEPHARKHGYGVVQAYCGHGIGHLFHYDVQVPHYDDPTATQVMEEGMTFTIEPMITQGSIVHRDWDDGWTVVTADGKRSAQFEHTVLVTRDGVEILTLP